MVEVWQVEVATAVALMKRLGHQGDMPYDPVTGELVEGVTYHPASRPKSFQVRYEADGRERVIDAWRTGGLAALVGTDVLTG